MYCDRFPFYCFVGFLYLEEGSVSILVLVHIDFDFDIAVDTVIIIQSFPSVQ